MTASDDVLILSSKIGYQGFFQIAVHQLQFRKFDGTMSPTITREIFSRGEAAAVLPYDPERDEVILIRQFLPGAHFAGRASNVLQIIAGMIGAGETPEDVACREAVEEADCAIGHIEKAAAFLPSPGGSSEVIHVYVAEADSSIAGGVHGLAVENEDIRVEVMKADAAIALLDAGEIEAGPAVVGLLWFARHHQRIRREWLAARHAKIDNTPTIEAYRAHLHGDADRHD
jgi:ADP-ribose pyrophosphatase